MHGFGIRLKLPFHIAVARGIDTLRREGLTWIRCPRVVPAFARDCCYGIHFGLVYLPLDNDLQVKRRSNAN